MFVLVKAWEGNLGSDSVAFSYDTYDIAFMAMVRQLEEEVAKNGGALKEVDWGAIAAGDYADLYDEDDLWCGTVEMFHVHCELCCYEWHIFEVCGRVAME